MDLLDLAHFAAQGAFIFMVLGALVGLVIHMRGEPRRREKFWRSLAAQVSGLRVERDELGAPKVVGTCLGVPLEARYQESVLSGHRRTDTVVTAECRRRLPPNFRLSRQNGLSGVAEAFGAQDIQVKDAAFDAMFVVQGADRDLVQGLLSDSKVRATLVSSARNVPGFHVTQSGVGTSKWGAIKDVRLVRSWCESVARAALASERGTVALPPAGARATETWRLEKGMGLSFLVFLLPFLGILVLVSADLVLPALIAWPIAIGLVAISARLAFMDDGKVVLESNTLALEKGRRRVALPLDRLRWGFGLWQKGQHFSGTLLYLENGRQRLTIGGVLYRFEDERYYRIPPASPKPDGCVDRDAFTDLLESLGYALPRER